MWLIVQFDLPVQTGRDVKAYRVFRSNLFRLGFSMLQKSVYMRYEKNDSTALITQNAVVENIPKNGHVSILRISDISMSNSLFYSDRYLEHSPHPPSCLMVC